MSNAPTREGDAAVAMPLPRTIELVRAASRSCAARCRAASAALTRGYLTPYDGFQASRLCHLTTGIGARIGLS